MVRIYSMLECPYCVQLKELLNKEGIEFTDVDIDKPENEDEYKKISEICKSDSVPIVRVGKQLLVPNISFRSIREAADLTKKFLG